MFFAGDEVTVPSSGSKTARFCPKLRAVWDNLELHLTDLTLEMPHYQDYRPANLRILSLFKAMRKLDIDCCVPGKAVSPVPYHNLVGQKLALQLPHLACLRLSHLKEGELNLLCPSLKDACFDTTQSLHIVLEDAALTSLVLRDCERVHFAVRNPEDQLRDLKSLSVYGSPASRWMEAGRRLIEDVSLMIHLEELECDCLPAACMPSSFPRGLRNVNISLYDWFKDVFKLRTELERLSIYIYDDSFQGMSARSITWYKSNPQPLAELLLSMGDINHLQMTVLERVVTNMIAKGLEAKATLTMSDTCVGWHEISVRDPHDDGAEHRFLEIRLPA